MKILLPGVALLCLAACGGGAPENAEVANTTLNAAETAANAVDALEQQPLEPVATNEGAGEAGQDSFTWTLFRSGGGSGFPVLIYGARSNDEVMINFQCREPGTVTVLQLRQGVGDTRSEPIRLSSGARRSQLPVTLGPDGADGNTPAVAQLPIGDPLFAQFRKGFTLGVTSDGRTRRADAIDEAEQATVERFFAACGS